MKCLISGNNSATFSEDMRRRFTLVRVWDVDRPKVHVVMCNPSVADHMHNDPTITRLRRRLGDLYGGFVVTNLFSVISSNPDALMVSDAMTDHFIKLNAFTTNATICAWGMPGKFVQRKHAVLTLLKGCNMFAFALSNDGTPKHPLYLPYGTPLVSYVTQV